MAGKTLIPYYATRHTDKGTVSKEHLSNIIYTHEDGVTRPNGEPFRYAKYPEINDEQIERYDII